MLPVDGTGEASLAMELARGLEATEGERPRLPSSTSELGTGNGREGEECFL